MTEFEAFLLAYIWQATEGQKERRTYEAIENLRKLINLDGKRNHQIIKYLEKWDHKYGFADIWHSPYWARLDFNKMPKRYKWVCVNSGMIIREFVSGKRISTPHEEQLDANLNWPQDPRSINLDNLYCDMLRGFSKALENVTELLINQQRPLK